MTVQRRRNARRNAIVFAYVTVTGGQLPKNRSDLLRKMREKVPDMGEDEFKDAISWAIRIVKRKSALLEKMMRRGCRMHEHAIKARSS